VAALLAVNSAGSVINPGTGRPREIGHSAADCVSRAIIKAILTASSLADKRAFCDLKPR